MSVVPALVSNPARLLRLRTALRGRHTVEPCADWGAVTFLCEKQPVHLVVLDLFASGEMSLEPLRQLKRNFPRVTTIAYVAVTPERAHDLFDVGRAGVDALVVADRDDEPSSLAAIVEQAEARSVATRLRTALAETRPTVRDAVMLCVTRAHERLTTESLAETLSLSRRVLAKHLEQAALPSPQRLLTWGRLVVAAHMLEDPHRRADRIALTLHFPSGSAFRNTCQRYLHATPSEIRARGGADFAMHAMLRDTSHDDDDGGDGSEGASDDLTGAIVGSAVALASGQMTTAAD
ncbi:MAG: helix-turn-helix domain-containing protein [Gemmatimonadetes bacterium]|nr:helix-turn-helix domain-containing protein [Gemmatimonadota bacterium]